jgi:predicted metal-dependent hydrolase
MADLQGPFETLPGVLVHERASKSARNIRIEVRPDAQVWLVIPRTVARQTAYAFLRSREDWIRRKLVELRERRSSGSHRPALRWDGSDTLPVAGIEMPLKIVAARIARPTVRFDEAAITLFCPASQLGHHAKLATLLRAALRSRARQDAKALLDEESARLDVDYIGPRIADQKSLWGSCTPDGTISLNWRLLLAPSAVFRYVIVHELCHRRHLDHSQRFWRLVERQMPDFALHRAWLREHGAGLHSVLPKSGREPQQPGLFGLLG